MIKEIWRIIKNSSIINIFLLVSTFILHAFAMNNILAVWGSSSGSLWFIVGGDVSL